MGALTVTAQMGSFVPAASAEIGLVDRLFSVAPLMIWPLAANLYGGNGGNGDDP